MTPAAKSAIADLLEASESLADRSLWADENRGWLPGHGRKDTRINQPILHTAEVSSNGRAGDFWRRASNTIFTAY
jgi:hypothetical protein